MPRCVACGDALHYPDHIRRGYCERDYCERYTDALSDAPDHRAATMGCVGTGDGLGERPRAHVNCGCAWPEVTIRTVPEPVLERLVDGFGWHVTPLGLECERCTADDALRAEASGGH